MTSRRRLVAAAVLSGACAAAGLTTAAPALAHHGHAHPDDPDGPGDVTTFDGPLALMGPDSVKARKYGKRVYTDLRVRAVAGAGDLEVRSHRPATDPYDGPITTTWTLGEQSGSFEAGTQEDFSGLPGLLQVTYTSKDGSLTRSRSVNACLNGEGERIQPDGAATNAYPWGCPYNAFTLGSVQGVQDGWASRIEMWNNSVRLPVGSYTATVRIGEQYAEAWGLDAAEATHTMTVNVRKARDRGGFIGGLRRDAAARDTSARAASEVSTRPAAKEPAARAAADLPEGTPVPDLRSLPAFDIGLNGKRNLMRFSANVWNGGNSPLVIDGFRTADEDEMAAYQYFFDTDGEQVAYQSVPESGFYWHAENHNHWHFEDFARYQLLDSEKEVIQDSGKVSFCLANTDAVDYTVDGADWTPDNTDLATSCGSRGSLSVREVLSAGSGDTYAQYRSGQAFNKIDELPNGTYYVRVGANPDGALVESDYENNVYDREVRLVGKGDKRRVVVPQIGIIDERYQGWFFGF